MSNYRVSKVKNGQSESIEYKDFHNSSDAESYAQDTSLYDDKHIYVVERKTSDDEYQGTKIFQHGQLKVTF